MMQQTLPGCAFCDAVPGSASGEAHTWRDDGHAICIHGPLANTVAALIADSGDCKLKSRNVFSGLVLIVDIDAYQGRARRH